MNTDTNSGKSVNATLAQELADSGKRTVKSYARWMNWGEEEAMKIAELAAEMGLIKFVTADGKITR